MYCTSIIYIIHKYFVHTNRSHVFIFDISDKLTIRPKYRSFDGIHEPDRKAFDEFYHTY